jgi:predicted lipid carrier protein YhbT
MTIPARLLATLPTTPLRHLLRLAPGHMPDTAMAAVITPLLRGQPLTERLAGLAGKRVCLHITDLGRELRLRITATGLASGWDTGAGRPWDVRICGRFEDFWQLATGGEDPDTLFFQRRLAIEGDVETGLTVKNLLDSLEYDWRAHIEAVFNRLLPPPRETAGLPPHRHPVR